MTGKQLQNIVNAVLENLDGRRGFELISTLYTENPEVYDEMYESLTKSAYDAIECGKDPAKHHFFPKSLK